MSTRTIAVLARRPTAIDTAPAPADGEPDLLGRTGEQAFTVQQQWRLSAGSRRCCPDAAAMGPSCAATGVLLSAAVRILTCSSKRLLLTCSGSGSSSTSSSRAYAVQQQRAFAAQQQQQHMPQQQQQPQQQVGTTAAGWALPATRGRRGQGLSGWGVISSATTVATRPRSLRAVACRHRLVVRFASRALCKPGHRLRRPVGGRLWCVVAHVS
jgi:hypothetical protein